METAMNETDHIRRRRFGAAAVAVAAFLVCAVIIVWSWNVIAAGLFGAPIIAFREAFAFELAVAAVGAVFGFAARLAGGGRHRGAAA
jgi:hypothetical protein